MNSKVFNLSNKRNNIWEEEKKPNKLCKYFKDNINIRLTFQMICFIFCTLCFVYQSQELVTTYLSGETIVETRVERFRYSKIPAITVCLPTLVAVNKIAENYLKNSTNPEDQTLYQEIKESGSTISEETYNKTKMFDIFRVPLSDLFEKVSLDDLYVEPLYTYSRVFTEQGKVESLPKSFQYHSILPLSDPHKCYTLFSDYDPNFANVTFEIKGMELRLGVNTMSVPKLLVFNKQDSHIAVHSSNILPEFLKENIFLPLMMGKINFVTYSESKSILLPPPYLTNCKNYDLKREGMRSDCINICVYRKIREELKIQCIFTNGNYRLVSQHISKTFPSTFLCNSTSLVNQTENVDKQVKFESDCQSQCPQNCLETYYNYEVLIRRNKHATTGERKNEFAIDLQHNRLLDMVIEHRPIMDWITMISNIGGLSGMWLGLSVVFLWDMFLERIIKVYTPTE